VKFYKVWTNLTLCYMENIEEWNYETGVEQNRNIYAVMHEIILRVDLVDTYSKFNEELY